MKKPAKKTPKKATAKKTPKKAAAKKTPKTAKTPAKKMPKAKALPPTDRTGMTKAEHTTMVLDDRKALVRGWNSAAPKKDKMEAGSHKLDFDDLPPDFKAWVKRENWGDPADWQAAAQKQADAAFYGKHGVSVEAAKKRMPVMPGTGFVNPRIKKVMQGKPTSPDDVANLVKLLNEARVAYVSGKPIMDDDSFDALEDRLRKWDKANPYFKQIGAPVSASERKVKLPFRMGSLGKIKTGKSGKGAVAKWIKEATFPLYIGPKYDGMAVLICVDDKGETKLYSRGNGTIGQDITHLLPLLRKGGKIGRLNKSLRALKGELILANSDFAKIKAATPSSDKAPANARNTMAGILSFKGIHPHTGAVRLIVHGQIAPRPTGGLGPTLAKLKAQGWTVAPIFTIKTKADLKGKAEDAFLKRLDATRAKHDFDLDGLVLTDSKDQQIAFKGPSDVTLCKVKKVEWQPSKRGVLIPVLILEKM